MGEGYGRVKSSSLSDDKSSGLLERAYCAEADLADARDELCRSCVMGLTAERQESHAERESGMGCLESEVGSCGNQFHRRFTVRHV